MDRIGWMLAVALALYAGFEGGCRYTARQYEEATIAQDREDCMDTCDADEDGDPGTCERLCDTDPDAVYDATITEI